MRPPYIDASALVKLIAAEPESDALSETLEKLGRGASSQLLEIEVRRAARRLGGATVARAESVLKAIVLLPLSPEVRRLAGEIPPHDSLRTLDAIHLASVLAWRERLGPLISYDQRLLAAATDHGLAVLSPGMA